MSFFFSDAALSSGDLGNDRISNGTLNKLGCKACPLKSLNKPKVHPAGNENAEIYWLGEAPGSNETKHGEPFIGEAGSLLKNTIVDIWCSMNEEIKPRLPKINQYAKKLFRFGNVIWTQPPGNRDPSNIEIECCRGYVEEDILKVRPKIIVGLGNIPLKWAINDTGIQAWRGRMIPLKIGDHVCWFFPIYHPSYVSRKMNSVKFKNEIADEELVFRRDIRNIFNFLLNEYVEPEVEDTDRLFDNVLLLDGHDPAHLDKLKLAFKRLSKEDSIALDIETYSRETVRFRKMLPFGQGAKILTVSVGTYDFTVAFALDHSKAGWTEKQKQEVRRLFFDFLVNTESNKIAHNLSFELSWLIHEYGDKWVYDVEWDDTQAQTYIINGLGDFGKSKALQNLDNLCLQYFGFNLKKYSPLDKENLDLEDLTNVLRYNAGDVRYTHKLYLKQKEELDRLDKQQVYYHQVTRVLSTTLMTYRGIHVDQKEVQRIHRTLVKEVNQIIESIESLKCVEDFKSRYGKGFNPGSDKDCILMFKNVLKRTEVILPNGKESVDRNVLEKIPHEISSLLIQYREKSKLLSTYISPMLEENRINIWDDGKLHPRYNTTFVTTRRLSSDGPNAQNFPKKRNSYIRKIVVPPKGHWLLTADYGSFEARVIAMASNDKNLVTALWHGYDIHGSWAERIIELYPEIEDRAYHVVKSSDEKKIFKMVRHFSKNELVFPAFYGAGYKSISKSLGISEDLGQQLLNEFWEAFPGVKEWHQKVKKQYREDGYVELLTGFRRYAPLSRPNAIINSMIQGTAADMAVDAMDRLSYDSIKLDKPQLQSVMNIHDDLGFEIPDASLDDDAEYIINSMLNCPFDFITVPLVVEVKIGRNWYDMKPLGEFDDSDRRKKPEYVR